MASAPMANPIVQPGGGGNPSGFNVNSLPPVGGNGNNPLMSAMPSAQQKPDLSSLFGFPANVGPGGPTDPFAITKAGIGGAAQAGNNSQGQPDLARGFRAAGVPSNIASALAAFIHQGSGYNPQVLQALIASIQPQVNRGEADIMEHFGSMGLGMSSPAAIGIGDYLSQVNLNESQIAAQLYEQSVQNYLQVMLGHQDQSRGINASIQDVMKSVDSIGTLGGLLGGSTPGPSGSTITLGGG